MNKDQTHRSQQKRARNHCWQNYTTRLSSLNFQVSWKTPDQQINRSICRSISIISFLYIFSSSFFWECQISASLYVQQRTYAHIREKFSLSLLQESTWLMELISEYVWASYLTLGLAANSYSQVQSLAIRESPWADLVGSWASSFVGSSNYTWAT